MAQKGTLSFKTIVFVCLFVFSTDIAFPTQSAIIYQVGAHLLHFLCRWVKILPVVECRPGARHWVELNINFVILPFTEVLGGEMT